MKKIFLIILSLFIPLVLKADYFLSIDTLFSQNRNYFIVSYNHGIQNHKSRNKSFVYQLNSVTPVYSIDLPINRSYFNDLTFLSNDGSTVCIIDCNSKANSQIVFYKNGKQVKAISKSNFIFNDSILNSNSLLYLNKSIIENNIWKPLPFQKGDDSLFCKSIKQNGRNIYLHKTNVNEIEKFANLYSTFLNNDTLYIITIEKLVCYIDFKDYKIIKFDLLDSCYKKIKNVAGYMYLSKPAHIQLNFPVIKNGLKLDSIIEQRLNMKKVDGDLKLLTNKRVYLFQFSFYLNHFNKLEDFEIDEYKHHPLDSIKNILFSIDFESLPFKFDTNAVFFAYRGYFVKNNDSLAKQEYLLDSLEDTYRNDSLFKVEVIDNIYIPKDLIDCCIELDKQLNINTINEIDKFNSEDEMIKYHFGFAAWIRNSWGLWRGSRISVYIKKTFGITHPDYMSGIILTCYYRHRHKLPLDLDSFKEKK